MFQAAHAAIDAACKEDQISPLMQRPWHELARAQNLRVVNARDNNELHIGLLLLEDHVRRPSNEWILIGFDMEGNDKGDHGVDHLYQIAFETVVILVRPTDFVRVRRVLNKANVLVAAFDAADATQLRGLLPRARVVDVQLAAAQAGDTTRARASAPAHAPSTTSIPRRIVRREGGGAGTIGEGDSGS